MRCGFTRSLAPSLEMAHLRVADLQPLFLFDHLFSADAVVQLAIADGRRSCLNQPYFPQRGRTAGPRSCELTLSTLCGRSGCSNPAARSGTGLLSFESPEWPFADDSTTPGTPSSQAGAIASAAITIDAIQAVSTEPRIPLASARAAVQFNKAFPLRHASPL